MNPESKMLYWLLPPVGSDETPKEATLLELRLSEPERYRQLYRSLTDAEQRLEGDSGKAVNDLGGAPQG